MADRKEESALARLGGGLVRNGAASGNHLIVIPSEVKRCAKRIVLRSRGTLCFARGRPYFENKEALRTELERSSGIRLWVSTGQKRKVPQQKASPHEAGAQ